MNGTESLFSSSAGSVAVIALVLAILASGGVVLLLARQQRLLGQYEHLMAGTSGGNLEEMLNDHISQVREASTRVEAVDKLVCDLEESAQFSLQHLALVRFNPFRHTGGAQSFALALADDSGDGFVLSGLHARENTRVYAKPLHEWTSEHMLTDEEKQAIERAQRQQTRAKAS